jgi:hypothetical protein
MKNKSRIDIAGIVFNFNFSLDVEIANLTNKSGTQNSIYITHQPIFHFNNFKKHICVVHLLRWTAMPSARRHGVFGNPKQSATVSVGSVLK